MYIQYTMDQLCLPMDLEDDIPQNHLVRVVNAAVNRLDDTIFTSSRCLKPHLEKVRSALGKLPGTVIADAGYGGEENYTYLEEAEIKAVVKYSTYHKKEVETMESRHQQDRQSND